MQKLLPSTSFLAIRSIPCYNQFVYLFTFIALSADSSNKA